MPEEEEVKKSPVKKDKDFISDRDPGDENDFSKKPPIKQKTKNQ